MRIAHNADTDRAAQVELERIPGFDAAYDAYAAELTDCLAEINAAFKTAPMNKGVPQVRTIMDRHENRLRDLYGHLHRLADEYHE